MNIANVLPQDTIEAEALRVGLGVVGPKSKTFWPQMNTGKFKKFHCEMGLNNI